MMKMMVQRKQNVIQMFSKTRILHGDAYWEDQTPQNGLFFLEDHAHLTIGSETRERLLLLSTDSLIVAKTKSLYLKLKDRVSLSDIWLASCIHHITNRKVNTKTSFVMGWPTTNYVVTLSSSQMKDRWLSALQWHSVRARQRLIPSHIILNVELLDMLLTAAVSVEVNSTSDSVIQSVIQQNSLTGGVSDYQLCVLYDGDEEMYPLIGHELPYCILFQSLRGQRSQHALSRHQWHSADELRVTDDVKEATAPRFLLRSRAEIHTHIHTGSLKHKRKKSLIGWALRKGHAQSDGQTALKPASNKLFGQSLASVCHNGNLPKAIMDLLCILYCEGPKTLGIFRRSANARSCRILKEKLNSGCGVSLHGESVFVAASLLTEFLRNLPGSVLGCELYEDWMNAMKTDDQQCRCSSVKSVLAKLPQVNRTLLCYVFGVLHHIHTHSDVNQMTAANLALCVTPNMLWRSTASHPEQESQSTLEVAALVRFLIEDAPSIFGNEAEETFTNTVQENDDLTANVSLPLHSSSEATDLDFLPSSALSPDLEPFLSLSSLSLNGNRKLPTLKISSEITDGIFSCGRLDLVSAHPYSLSEFSQSRDRCLSEPSMCFGMSTPPQAPPHPPVIRQSSCDNSVMANKMNQPQSPVMQGRSRGAGKGRYTFWKSPQFPTRLRHPAQRLASVSSLSSTTTSSLSSLDSFEYNPSPSDDKPRPFLFGSSARLHPLTPEMPRKLWTFTYDELKDRNRRAAKDEEKVGGVKCLDINFKDESKTKGEEDENVKADRCDVMKGPDGQMRAMEEQGTSHHDEVISCHMVHSNEDRDLGMVHTLSHTHPCPVHTTHTHTLHTHSLTLPSKRDKISRMKITLFPSVGRRRIKQSGKVTIETGGEAVTVPQVNLPQTLFYNHEVNLVRQSEGRHTDDVCTCKDICVSKATGDASCELSFNTAKKDSCLNDTAAGIGSEDDGIQTFSDISDSKSFNQGADDVSQSDPSVSSNASASTDHKISINVNEAIQCDPGNDNSHFATTVSISSIDCDSDSCTVSNSIVDNISESVSHSANQSINTTTTSMNQAVSMHKVSQSVSISPANANQNPSASIKTSIRQTIRIRLPATVRNSVRAYFSPTHPLTHTRTHSATHTESVTHTETHTLSKSQNRPLFTSKLQ